MYLLTIVFIQRKENVILTTLKFAHRLVVPRLCWSSEVITL